MPEQGMSLEQWRARKGAAAPSSGGGMSLEAWRAQKAQPAPAPKPTFAPGADEAVMALPTMPKPSLGPNLGAVRGLGPARAMEPTSPPVRLDDMGAMEEVMMRRVLPIASRAMENTATGIQAPIEDQFRRMQAEVANQKMAGRGFLTGVPAAVANQIVPGTVNAASSAMAAIGAPLAPLGAAGQIIDEREGYRDERTGQIVPGSGTPGLALSEKLGRPEPTLGEMLTRIGRAPENVMGQASTVGRSIARVPATLAGADPEDETSASPLAQSGTDLVFQGLLGGGIPALRGRLASAASAAERGALARGLAATPEPIVRSADLMPDRPVAPQTFRPLRAPADAALDAGGKPSVSVTPQTQTGTGASSAQGVAVVGRKGVRRFNDAAAAQEFAKPRGLGVTEKTAGDGRVWYEVEPQSAKPQPVAAPESSPIVASAQTPDATTTSAQPAPPAPPRPMTGEAVPPEVARQAVGGAEALPPERPLKPSLPRSGRGKASVPERPFVPPEPEAPQPVGVSAVGGEPVAPAKVGAASRPEKPFSSKPASVRPSDAALGGAKPELVPPPGEGTVPTRGERAIAAQGGPEAVAAKTGRVVVEQADGTKLLVSEAERPRAEALAAEGKLAEFVNGEGTSPKPAAPTEAVIARDASGAEVRTVLTDTPEKTASAVAAQEAQGLKVEVVPANEGTIGKVLADRETPAPTGRLKGPRAPGASGSVEVKYGNGGETQMRSGFSPEDLGPIAKGAKALASGAENAVKSTIDRFQKDYGKAGKALADEILNVKVQTDINRGRVFTDANREYGKLGMNDHAEVSANLRKWVEGKAVVPAKYAPLVKEVRSSLSTMADILDESGVRVADEATGPRTIKRVGDTYFPRAFDPDWLKAIRDENKPGHTGPTPLTDEWKALNGNTTENPWLPKPTTSRSRLDPSFYSANELPRKFKYPDKAMAPDDWTAYEQHVQRSSSNAAEHRVFQYRDIPGGGGKSLGRLEQLVEAAAQENVKGENPQTARGALEDMTLHSLGRHESVFGSSWTKKAAEAEGTYQAATKLGGSLFNIAQQISQMINNAAILGNKATTGFSSKLFVDTMKTLSRLEDPRNPWREATAQAQRKGVLKPEAFSTSLDLTEGVPSKFVQGTRRATRMLTRPSEFLDRLGRLTTAEVAPEALKKAEAGLKAGGKEAAAAERHLRDVRMSDSDIAALRDGTANEFVRRKYEILLNGMVNIEGGAMMRPMWVNKLDNFAPGAGQIAYRFKNYPVQQMKVAKVAIKEAANGNPRPLIRLATWTIVHGEALAKLREALWGEDEQRKDWDEIIENRDWGGLAYRLGQDIALSGTLGLPGSFLPPLAGEDKAGRTFATAERTVTPPVATTISNYWNAAKDTTTRKTMTEDGPLFRGGRPARPMDREDAFWQELDELARREVGAYRTVREQMDDAPTDSRGKKR